MSDSRQMLREIEREVVLTRHLTGRSTLDPGVMQALREVPRHEFVPEGLQEQAYYNGPLPIGQGQTISQPFIVALMTDLLTPRPESRVLEVGTGSGYQTAVLSRVVAQVYSLEIIEALSVQAQERLRRLGYDNISYRVGDGYQGWPEQAPFDAILVTAAAPHIPQPLIEQLRTGGRLVIPVGEAYGQQELMLVEKDRKGKVASRPLLGVAFVPLTRDQGESLHE